MTVTYAQQVASSSRIGTFRRIITIYRGSVYKLATFELLIYLTLYLIIACVYQFVLSEGSKTYFEAFVMYCQFNHARIPITFVLAFYMNHVVSRWWETWKLIPWPDSIALKLNTFLPNLPGKEDECREVRRNIMRYINLSITETFRMMSSPVMKRFPTYQHLIDAGLMTPNEMHAIQMAQDESEFVSTFYWLPLNWAGNLLISVERKGLICRRYVSDILQEITRVREKVGDLFSYDWISVPLVYSQLVTLAVYSYFVAALFGRQGLDDSNGKSINGYKHIGGFFDSIPLFLSLEFLFFIGWLKAAEVLINPYGEDDDDFETNYMIDRHLQICYLYVDMVGQNPPEVGRDPHWDIGIPEELPYTVASLQFRIPNMESAAENLKIPLEQHRRVEASDIDSVMGNQGSNAMRKISKRLQKAMGLSNIVSLAASPIVARKRVSDSPFVSKKVSQVRVSTISSPIVGHKRTSMKTENEKTRKGSSGNEKTRKGSSGSFQRNKNHRIAERNRKTGKDVLGLSDDTLRKLSALLWHNGNDNCRSSDYGVKINDAKSSSDQPEAAQLKEANVDNANNNKEDLKHCIVEIYEQKDNATEFNVPKNSVSSKADVSQKNKKEADAEILHQGDINSPTIRRVSADQELKNKNESEGK